MKNRNLTLSIVAAVACLMLTGCNHLPRASAPDQNLIFDRFDQVVLNEATSTQILPTIKDDDLDEYVSQSESVIAAWATKSDDAVAWINLIAFGEDDLTATRKYAVLIDEDSPGWQIFILQGSKNLRFEAQVTVDQQLLDEPYSKMSEKIIAIIQEFKSLVNDDFAQVQDQSATIMSERLLLNQVLTQIIAQAEKSTSITQRITEVQGMKFDHSNFGTGRIRMMIEGNIVRIKIKLGDWAKNFEKHNDVINMQ